MRDIRLEDYGISKSKLPVHVAIIMDGNGRWASKHKLPVIEGHREGVESVRDIVESCRVIGVKYLTIYTFSEENWYRPPAEVAGLLKLLHHHLESEIDELNENKVRVQFIGRINKFPSSVKKRMERMLEVTAKNKGLVLSVALSYGGRAEIIDAVNKIVSSGVKKVNEKSFYKYLYDPGLPDPDLLVRTSGEQRISNFFLYQLAYSEIYITPVLWPDFRTPELLDAIKWFQQRERRFGRR